MQSSILLLAFAALVSARTDLSGCVSSETVAFRGASLLWYVPGSGEICDFLDCGGGRAPPKTTVPGCPLYSGTATYSPSYLAGFQDGPAAVSSTTFVSATSTTPSTSLITGSQTTAAETQETTLTSVVDSASDVLPTTTGTGLVTSITGTASGSQSESQIQTQSQGQSAGTTTTGSSPGTSSGSSTTSGSAPAASASDNAGTVASVNFLSHGFVGAVAAGFAFLL